MRTPEELSIMEGGELLLAHACAAGLVGNPPNVGTDTGVAIWQS